MPETHHSDGRRYWDSCAFLVILNDEDGIDKCQDVIEACKDRRTIIVTSALALAEVVKIKHRASLPKESAEKIKAFFEHEYIVVRPVTRRTAEFGRELVWNHGVQPKDGIHVATALENDVRLLETLDDDLLRIATLKIEGFDPLDIEKPWWPAPKLPGSTAPA